MIMIAPMNALTGSITTTLKYPDTNARQREVGIHEKERVAKPVTPDHAVHFFKKRERQPGKPGGR